MEFDFFNEWEQVGTVKVGGQLAKKLVQLESIDSLEIDTSVFPPEYSDAGCDIERYVLGEMKYIIAKEICNILAGECHKIANLGNNEKAALENGSNNPQVLIQFLSLMINSSATHFTLG